MNRIISKTISAMIDGGMKLLGVTDRGVRILCYHRVNYHEQKYTTVSVDSFRDQMRYLAEHGFRTIGLGELIRGETGKAGSKQDAEGSLRRGDAATRREEKPVIASEAKQSQTRDPSSAPQDDKGERLDLESWDLGLGSRELRHNRKGIIITFDDGYRDNYVNAFPVMKEFGFKGCVFCVSDEIGKESFLRVDEIREMADAGFEFGSHTMSHPELVHLDEKSKWLEISESKKRLEAMLDLPVPYFCYPKGLWDEESADMVARAGYVAACSNRPGSNQFSQPDTESRKDSRQYAVSSKQSLPPASCRLPTKEEHRDIYLLRRTEIGGSDDLNDFRRKLNGAYDFLHAVLHFVRGRP